MVYFYIMGSKMSTNSKMPLVYLGMNDTKFWAKVDMCGPDACWMWKAGYTRSGYGQHKAGVYAHRYAWEQANNASIIPGKQNVVRHSCDRPACCNPAHLTLGSQSDNMMDMQRKGRGDFSGLRPYGRLGENNHGAKLTAEAVTEIRRLHKTGDLSLRAIAVLFNVRHSTIEDVVRRRTWRHIES